MTTTTNNQAAGQGYFAPAESAESMNGVAIKLPRVKITVWAIIIGIFVGICLILVFDYIWTGFNAYDNGYTIGKMLRRWFLPILLGVFVLYLGVQYLLLYLLNGRNRKHIAWTTQAGCVGFYPLQPITLRNYRLVMLLPGIVLGILPLLHGFCTGNFPVYFFGLYGCITAYLDWVMWFRLRKFDDEDLYQGTKDSYQATIIRRNYGR